MTVKERLKKFIQYKKISIRSFETTIGVSFGYVNNIRVSIQPDKVTNIAIHFPELNTGWLLTGEGEMLKNNRKEEAILVNPNIIEVPIISQYAYAGYLGGFDDPVYMESLPTQPIYMDRELKGHYVIFEVKGDSMDNDSKESLQEGDLLLSREVKKEYWRYKLHINKWNYVIIHKTEGVIVKRIIKHDVEKGIISIRSLNPMYEDKELFLEDIAQLFNVVQIQRKFKI